MKITLYHGSTLSIEHPLAKVGRADLDFGRGFYLTSLRSQAERWATRVQLLRASTTAWINVYEFDMDAAIKAGFKLLRFDAYDQDISWQLITLIPFFLEMTAFHIFSTMKQSY